MSLANYRRAVCRTALVLSLFAAVSTGPARATHANPGATPGNSVVPSESLAVAGATPQGATRSVNMAIIGLGALWIVLMVRRIQLQGAALRHAEVGH